MEAVNQLSKTLTFSWQNMIFGFLSSRRNQNCWRVGHQTIGFQQKTCEAEEDGDREQNRSLTFESLQLVISTRVRDFLDTGDSCTLETRIGCEDFPTMMFQQIVFSFREEARITRCHKEFSTTTFLLSSKITQLDRRPAGTFLQPILNKCDHQIARLLPACSKNCRKICLARRPGNVSNCSAAQLPVRTMLSEVVSQKTQPSSFSRVCVLWFPTPSERSNENQEVPRCCMASVRQGASEQLVSTKSHR